MFYKFNIGYMPRVRRSPFSLDITFVLWEILKVMLGCVVAGVFKPRCQLLDFLRGRHLLLCGGCLLLLNFVCHLSRWVSSLRVIDRLVLCSAKKASFESSLFVTNVRFWSHIFSLEHYFVEFFFFLTDVYLKTDIINIFIFKF